jgi:hypothetical protein
MTSTTATLPAVTSAPRGAVTLGKTTFDVVELLFSAYVDAISGETRPASSEWHLIGARGARYLLRPYLLRAGQNDNGVRQVISLGSGAPLRQGGNEVRVVVVGDIIEKYVPTTRG